MSLKYPKPLKKKFEYENVDFNQMFAKRARGTGGRTMIYLAGDKKNNKDKRENEAKVKNNGKSSTFKK